MIAVVQAYYQGVFGPRGPLMQFSPPLDRELLKFSDPVVRREKRAPQRKKSYESEANEFRFFNREAVLGALTSFQVGVLGFLVGYAIAGFEAGFFGWLLGLSVGLLAGKMVARS